MPLNMKETTFDWFVCQCGNSPLYEGFDTCLMNGTIVEPTPAEWDGLHYVCLRCYAIYNQDTFEEVPR